ncbi:potassium transporter TrkG [Kocuria sp. CPCC 205292]|uniref:Potassium transporter Trk n=1 Tax=Kocuria rosea subsp. polaris TaxID=136273 RepID=A0A0W8IQJ6_KOCRO|nr:potassium transporter TrkG [Kocuria polaris]KUG62261.1 potassium transporter Trk [Kocuria polaris]
MQRGSWIRPEERGRFWLLTSLRDLVDRIAASSPARLALIVFAVVVAAFSLLLWLPVSSAPGIETSLEDAVFTATSAVTVTGLTTVPTGANWSFFGQFVIMVAMQIGGLGTLTMTSILALAVGRKLGLRSRLLTQEALNIGRLGEVGSLLQIIVLTSVSIEAVLAAVLTVGFLVEGEPFLLALWQGVFYAISAFNNGGFVPNEAGLGPYTTAWLIVVPIALGVFIGSLGFPVILVVRQVGLRFTRWNLNTKLTVTTTTALLVLAWIMYTAFEWSNPGTLRDLPVGEKIFNGFFSSVNMRSGGFALVDTNSELPQTLLMTDAMMFAGGGSASTAGGIKVTTLAVLFLAVLAEARGDRSVIAFYRTIPEEALRIAISVTMMGATIVLVACGILLAVSDAPLDRVLFEVISAYATCGLSVGLSAELPPEGKYVLAATMFVGRIGITTVAAALALRSRRRLYKYPEERPIIG